MEPITINFKYSPSDSIHAHRVYRSTTWGYRIVIITVLLMGILHIYCFEPKWQAIFWFLIAIAEWLDAIQALKVFFAFRKNPTIVQDAYTMTLDDNGVLTKNSTRETRHLWTSFLSLIESEKTFVLEYGKGMYGVIPKHAFSSEDDVDKVRNVLQQKITDNR